MFPFNIKTHIKRDNLDLTTIGKTIGTSINSRKIKKISSNRYEVEEPTISQFRSPGLLHEIIVDEGRITFCSSSTIGIFVASIVSIALVVFTILIYQDEGPEAFLLLLLIPIAWIIILGLSYFNYLFYIPTLKKIKRILELQKNTTHK